jgi:tetratricopeptide (TPR) repeat protein
LLSRLGKYEEAKEWLEDVAENLSNTVTSWDRAESWALVGRIKKEAWINSWRREGRTIQEMWEDAAYEDARLREVIETYAKGFRTDPSHYYSGINAVTLMHLLWHMTGKEEKAEERRDMEGGLRWAAQTAIAKRGDDCYWAKVTLGDLEVLTGDEDTAERAYKDAVAIAEKDWFNLDSPRQQLLILNDLGFRPGAVDAALKVFDRAMENLKPPEARWEPHLVFLFSGHMIDHPDRPEPRFPPDKEGIVAEAIAKKLDELGAGPQDLAISGGACGGDLLFAEACLACNVRLEVHIPFEEPGFLQESVNFAGEKWRDRFYRVKKNPNAKLFVMPEELGPPSSGVNPHARNNLWLLYSALVRGPEKVRFVCLWDRKSGDGPGGTKDMYDAVLKHSGHVHVLDINELW